MGVQLERNGREDDVCADSCVYWVWGHSIVQNSASSMACRIAESRRRDREVDGFVDILGSTRLAGCGKQKADARRPVLIDPSAGWSQVCTLTKRIHDAECASRKKGNLVQSTAGACGARCDYFLFVRAATAGRVESEGVRYIGGGRLSARTSTPGGKLHDAAR